MKKKRFELPINDVNVVPLMDILTTMLFFLVLMASISKFSSLSADAEISNMISSDEKKPRFELAMWSKSGRNIELRLSPIKKLKIVNKSDLISGLRKSRFSGSEGKGYRKRYYNKDIKKLGLSIQKDLMVIKRGFPHELKITLVVEDRLKFQDLINFMGTVTELNPSLGDFELENLLGKKENTTVLFPEIALREMGEVKNSKK